MANKAISDQEIIAAVLECGTFEQAAQTLGISARTLRDRLKNPDCRADLMAARDDVLRRTVTRLNNELSAAVDTISEVMANKENSGAVRLSAAQAIIKNAFELSDKLTRDETKTRKENATMADSILESFYE